jgi:O-antigen/teichoic acid export membrane protein
MKLIGSIILLIILAIILQFLSNDFYTKGLIFIIACATIFQSFNVIDLYFQSKVLSKFIVYANFVSLFISSVVKITLIFNSAALEAFVWLVVFDSLVIALGYLYYFFKFSNVDFKNLKFNSSIAILLLKNSWPLILSGLVVSVYMKIDQVMIKEILGDSDVGQYAAALRISEAWYFIPSIIASSLFPAIINAKKHSEILYYMRIQKLYDLMVLISVSVAISIFFLSDFLIEYLYGSLYSPAANVLVIHIWSAIFVFFGVASGNWFLIENLQNLLFYRSFSGMILNVILNIILIPIYGITGAALATLFSQILATYIFDFFTVRTKKTFLMKTKSLLFINLIKKISTSLKPQ